MNDEVKVDTPEQAEFRAYCREWVAKNKPGPPPPPDPTEGERNLAYRVAWQKSAYEGELVGCDYPKEYGGGGRTDCQRVANEEMQRVGTPTFPNLLALRMGAPALLVHGSEWQRKRFLPKIFSCEEIWCQGYSEPNAGSDVANQQTFAERKGDMWVINGHKVWTSFAHFSHWMQLLCRTDHSHKYKGLSYFLVPMTENLGKTIEVRPLIKMTGETGFNEVFLNDVTIPDKYRVDEVGMGWTVAMTLLQFERSAGGMVEPAAGSLPPNRDVSSIVPDETPIIVLAKRTLRNGRAASEDPVIRDRMMELLIRKTGFEQSNRRAKVKGLVDHPMRIPMQVKLVDTEIGQELAALGTEIEGVSSTFRGIDKNAPNGGRWSHEYMSSYGLTISAGSSEIQRNQLGERVLGLPKTK